MSRTVRAVFLAAGVFLAGGVIALGYAAYVVTETRTFQATELRRFERASPAAAAAPPLVEGGPIGEIRIPRLGLAAMVLQGDSDEVLRLAVGHLAETALPGESGNVVLAGHRDTFFRPLEGVKAGDVITLNTRSGAFTYSVESTSVVPPTDLRVIRPTGRRSLTLIACFPFAYIGSAPHRFIVRALETDGVY